MKQHMKCHKLSAAISPALASSAVSEEEEQEEKEEEDWLEISAMEEWMPVFEFDNIFDMCLSCLSEDIAQL